MNLEQIQLVSSPGHFAQKIGDIGEPALEGSEGIGVAFRPDGSLRIGSQIW